MLRKLIALGLIGAGIAAILKRRSEGTGESHSQPSAEPAPAPQADTPPQGNETIAEVRPGQTGATIESPVVGAGGEEAVMPDTSADDPVVREQEAAAAEDAGSIGGEADSATADAEPEMRPVVEGAGDAPETFESTEEQGR